MTAVPIALAAAALADDGPATGLAFLLAASALIAGFPESGINLAPLLIRKAHRPPGETIRIVSWNTQYWYSGVDDPGQFYQYIAGLGADVYLLQEYIIATGEGTFRNLNDDDRLRAAFPGYQVVVKGQLVTISRLPVESLPAVRSTEILRVDLRAGRAGQVISTYNVHIPLQIPSIRPVGRFLGGMRRRSRERERHHDALVSDLSANPGPAVVAGDFNASPATGDLRRLRRIATDAARASTSLYPVSWHAAQRWLRLWRLDWVFVRGKVCANRYELIHPGVRSDHRIQFLAVTIRNV